MGCWTGRIFAFLRMGKQGVGRRIRCKGMKKRLGSFPEVFRGCFKRYSSLKNSIGIIVLVLNVRRFIMMKFEIFLARRRKH